MREIILDSFDKKLDSIYKDKNQDVLKFLKNHPRKTMCIDNLCTEVKKIEIQNAVNLDRERIQWLGESYAVTFAKLALGKVERDQMTKMQKIQEERAIAEAQEIEKLYQEEVEEIDRSEEL